MAQDKGRNINVAVTGRLPIEGYRALLKRIEEGYEKRIAAGDVPAAITSGTGTGKIVASANDPHRLYVFTLTGADFAAGDYEVTFVEVAPNPEAIS